MPIGRPTTLTVDVCDAICEAIRQGNYRDVAAQWAGVPLRTFRGWCRRGKTEESGPFCDFWHAILEAERAAEIKMVGVVIEAAKADPRHAQWWLERKFPHRWGNNTRELRALSKQLEKLAKTGVPGGSRPDHAAADRPALGREQVE